ncbi:D-alanyl-D-alanine carboxypeptidase/D-alanyl-D-alanine endopeptidase [Mucilaginibacter arboris]|uniref:D-alanyl-D-alanine carboxypeptidase/D-alanyl-D-alanine-endopeptidase n=1 Tax=Mucilaginibacter arboris TaxID=2682090 RepID=A0A7K1T1E5_9SPHI|nr:D-alanyl-D-alanine carboxypeptidase/D-alanyl-D-alanine-endopeptidase [Mucilaginibacter arboris]MVN23396.1 D-alanyl-D-alanine carboxypeptidase/D-alanyl-D-alanine-endopeptidase [Mucilaginibacter arboris]
MPDKRSILFLALFFLTVNARSQSLDQKLQTAFTLLEQDAQCKYASVSLTVLDAKTGETVFTAHPNMGLATASTLKTITAITAFNLLGKDFQYQTTLGYNGIISADGTLKGNLIIKGGGDPTLGSWRYESSKENTVLKIWVEAIRKAGIKKIEGRIIGDDTVFGNQKIPDGWNWQVLGNYYGAGTSGLCWRENQFDIKLQQSGTGNKVKLIKTIPVMPYVQFNNELLTGAAGSGDQAYAFLPVKNSMFFLSGTYAEDLSKRSISAALPDPAFDAAYRLTDTLNRLGIVLEGTTASTETLLSVQEQTPQATQILVNIASPKLSGIIFWMNKKSINLYAEQLLKTFAWKAGKSVTTDNGVQVLQGFWKAKGIGPNALNIFDGSGLSPGDRVTTSALATILSSAKKETWFSDFLKSLPVINDMTMKSGSISNVQAYAGYQTKNGRELCFSIIVNNYNGSSLGIKTKMFRVLDELK